jgi:hypothetical protein
MRRAILLFALASALLLPTYTSLAAQVDGLQIPAWVEHAGIRQPARAGMPLAAADIVETGKGGRLIIQLADGSFVKLGEEMRLALTVLREEDEPQSTLTGLFDVVKGAFRYTADTLGRMARRDLQVQVANTTLAIHGTDLWGRNKEGEATVCLLEGKITLSQPQLAELSMDQPQTFLVAPHDGEPQPVAPVDPEMLKQWLAETELNLGRGVILPGGGWVVQLGSHNNEATARKIEARLLADGIPVEFTTVQLKDRTFHRLRVSNFDTQQDAKYFADKLRGQPGIPKPWVTCSIPGSSCQ